MTENDRQIEIAISLEEQINEIPGFHDERELYDFDYRKLLDLKRRAARITIDVLLYDSYPKSAKTERRDEKRKRIVKLRDLLNEQINKMEENGK